MGEAATAEQAGYTVSAVARRLGVAAATLRTWDRRYGMSPSLRTAGAHRRYTATDVALLERMRGFMLAGMPPADAAVAARSDGAGALAAPGADRSAVVVPISKGTAQQRGLERAAAAMDTNAAADLIRRCIDRNGVAWTWDEVIAPVMRAVGARYNAEDGAGIDVEHHLSHIVIRELIRHSDVRRPVNPRPVLLASAPEEQHTLPLYALSAALAERGIATRVLGSRTPDEALASAVRRTGPMAVFVWAQSRPTTDLRAAVPSIRPAVAVVVGGPGWEGMELPPEVGRPHDLSQALSLIASSVRTGQV